MEESMYLYHHVCGGTNYWVVDHPILYKVLCALTGELHLVVCKSKHMYNLFCCKVVNAMSSEGIWVKYGHGGISKDLHPYVIPRG